MLDMAHLPTVTSHRFSRPVSRCVTGAGDSISAGVLCISSSPDFIRFLCARNEDKAADTLIQEYQ